MKKSNSSQSLPSQRSQSPVLLEPISEKHYLPSIELKKASITQTADHTSTDEYYTEGNTTLNEPKYPIVGRSIVDEDTDNTELAFFVNETQTGTTSSSLSGTKLSPGQAMAYEKAPVAPTDVHADSLGENENSIYSTRKGTLLQALSMKSAPVPNRRAQRRHKSSAKSVIRQRMLGEEPPKLGSAAQISRTPAIDEGKELESMEVRIWCDNEHCLDH